MKKLGIMMIISMLLLSSMGAIALSPISENISESTHVFSLSVSELSIEEKEQFSLVYLKESTDLLIKPGTPQLPKVLETYTFPRGTEIIDVTCQPSDIETYTLDQKIQPSPSPMLLDGSLPEETTPLSYSNAPYPDRWFDYDVGAGIKDGEQCLFVKVQYYPVQYFPSENMIDVASDFSITIETKENDKLIQQDENEDSYQFVILSSVGFFGELQPLVDHKINRGISTKLVSLNDAYNGVFFSTEGRDNPERIKYFIKNAIENWDTQYVMLVGGEDEFPVRLCHILVDYDPNDPDDEILISDLYYADIYDEEFEFASWDTNGNSVFGEFDWGPSHLYDDVDLYPDVYLGRLAVTDNDELGDVVDKIITYETIESYKQDWFSEIMVIGGDTSPHDSANVDEGEFVNRYILDLMTGFSADKVWDSNYRLSWYSPSGIDNINTGFEQGRGFVDWAGHGAPTVWTTYPHNGTRQSLPTPTGAYRSSHILDLENPDMYPVVVVGACSTGKFSVSDCFAWAFVKNPSGGGIASLSASSLSWGYTTDYVVQGLGGRMHVSYFHAYVDGADTFGQMWADGVTRYIQPNMDGGEHKTGEQWVAFGDPTLQIAEPSNPPIKPETPEGPSRGKIGEELTFVSVATDPDGDDIYYRWDWGNGDVSNWVGPYNSGEQCEITHVWEQKGTLSVMVQAKDTNGKLGEWSDPLEVSMAKTKSIDLPLFDFLAQYFSFFSVLQNLFEL